MNDVPILVVATRSCGNLIRRDHTPWTETTPLADWQFQPRATVEEDDAWLQIIPYVVLRDRQNQVWAYARHGGDERLLGRRSVGIGGHIEGIDQQATLLDTVLACARRELVEELVRPEGAALDPQPCGWIHERETAIGRVHLGLVFAARWTTLEPPAPRPGEPLVAIGFISPATVRADNHFERWSRLAVALLLDPERGPS